jgi:hypothetical protein
MFSLKTIARAGLGLISIAAFLLSMETPAQAQISITITLNENGNATLTNTNGFNSPLPVSLQADPGPGGLSSALTYNLLNPPGLTAGDLLLLDPAVSGLSISDIVRFNPNQTCSGSNGCLVFYSDTVDGADSVADKGFPTALYANNLAVFEVGPEGNNGFSYTPTAGQPGFVAGAGGPVTYIIRSDTPVPEPSAVVLLGMGLTAFSVIAYRGRRLP